MLLGRMAGLALRVTNTGACSPAFLAKGHTALQHHARTLPTAGARRIVTVRAGTYSLSVHMILLVSCQHCLMHAENELPNRCAASLRQCQSHKSNNSYPLRFKSTENGPSFFLVYDTNAGVARCDCGCKSGRTAFFKPVWCVRSNKLQLQTGLQTLHTLHELREVCVVGNADGCIAAGHLQECRHTQQL